MKIFKALLSRKQVNLEGLQSRCHYQLNFWVPKVWVLPTLCRQVRLCNGRGVQRAHYFTGQDGGRLGVFVGTTKCCRLHEVVCAHATFALSWCWFCVDPGELGLALWSGTVHLVSSVWIGFGHMHKWPTNKLCSGKQTCELYRTESGLSFDTAMWNLSLWSVFDCINEPLREELETEDLAMAFITGGAHSKSRRTLTRNLYPTHEDWHCTGKPKKIDENGT